MRKHTLATFIATFAAAAGLAATALGGDLNPPAGAVGPTMKPLSQVEPRIAISNITNITQPGSYYLTRDLTTNNGNAITINASRVTLDLNGFSLVGQPGASKGIAVIGLNTDVTVRNGTITGWPVRGIEAASSPNCRYVDLAITDCGIDGLMSGARSIVSGCTARGNGEDGFDVGANSVVTTCTSAENDGHGFVMQSQGNISGCTATTNGTDGIFAFAGCRVSECVAAMNGSDGISAAGGVLISDNNCKSNGQAGTGAGIYAQNDGNRIEGNNVIDNDYGVQVTSAGNLVIRNSARDNSTGNFNVIAGNSVGPWVTAATIAANTNPHANYIY
ncbi:MAG: right-handed parallel beta-helix repeat-containing protein [Phycisphaerae bacterium]